ncbi:hypothetical protein C8R48DRAFT_677534 [Suillus tomentosus]|nr:hypothetical protein C8R48DRAFT_677534 [Suillus tomentosus]
MSAVEENCDPGHDTHSKIGTRFTHLPGGTRAERERHIDEKNLKEAGGMEDWKLQDFPEKVAVTRNCAEAAAVSIDHDAQPGSSRPNLASISVWKTKRPGNTEDQPDGLPYEPTSQNGDLLSEWWRPSFMSIGLQWTTTTVTVYSIASMRTKFRCPTSAQYHYSTLLLLRRPFFSQLFSFFPIFDYIESCVPVGSCCLPADALHNWSKILTYVMILIRLPDQVTSIILLCAILFALTDDSRQLRAILSQCNTSEAIAGARCVTIYATYPVISKFSILNCRSENSKLVPIRVCKSDTISSGTHMRSRACDRGLIREEKYTTDAIITYVKHNTITESSRIQTAKKKSTCHPESRVTRPGSRYAGPFLGNRSSSWLQNVQATVI